MKDLKEKGLPFSSLAPVRKTPQKSRESQAKPTPAISNIDVMVPSLNATENVNQDLECNKFNLIYIYIYITGYLFIEKTWLYIYTLMYTYLFVCSASEFYFFFCCLRSADGYSIYIKGLPYNATPSLLEDEFKKYGTIKNGGIQVRSKVCWLPQLCYTSPEFFKLFISTIICMVAARFLFWVCGI